MNSYSTDKQAVLAAILDHIYRLLPLRPRYGQIARAEAEFLANRVLERQPRVVVEIGTASGVSTAVVYSVLQHMGYKFRHIAIELLEYCYFDHTKKPGFIFHMAHSGPTPEFSLHTGCDSFSLEEVLAGEQIDFVFIDANHAHPWAVIDTILTLPFLADGATLVYHDVNLQHRGSPHNAEEQGPHQLFFHLPAANKIVLGDFPWPNIGALNFNRPAKEMLAPLIEIMLAYPWISNNNSSVFQSVVDRLCAFINRHWGSVVEAHVAASLAERLPQNIWKSPVSKPLTFRDALRLRLFSSAIWKYDDNSQRFYQFGDETARDDDRKILAAEPVANLDAILSSETGLAAFNEELDTKSILYEMLADAASREILVDLAAYRILGHRRVKLGYHGLDNVRLREDLLRRCMRQEQADSLLVEAISQKWPTDLFSLFDLSPLGRNLRIYSIGEEIYRFMYAPSYHCTLGNVVRPEVGDVVLDCGAAFGDVSLQFALTVGESGRVVCFEPYPLFLRVFRENMNMNPTVADRIELVERAAWDRDGETLSFIAGGGGSRIDEGGRAELKIATTTIDAVVRERKLPRVDFIKMDIEGAELKALRGAEATIRAYRPKLAVCLYHSPQDFREIPEYLDSLGLGYRFHLNQHYMNQWETVLYAEPVPQHSIDRDVNMLGTDLRVNPSITNYFIGEQYRCQPVCITEGFGTSQRIVAEDDNGSRPVLEWALTKIDRNRRLSILDIGCGLSQKMARLFGPHVNIHITGLDSVETTDLARRFNPAGTYIPCGLDSDESIAEASTQLGTFDVVFALDVIEHVLHPEKMIGLIKAHSRPDTMIFLTTLERDISAGAGPLTEGSRKPEHVREWNADEFRQFLRHMGLVLHEFKLTPLHGNQWCQTFLCSVPDVDKQRTSNDSTGEEERSSRLAEQRIINPSRQELLKRDAVQYAAERLRLAHVNYPPRWVTIGISSMCTNHCTFCSYHSLDARDSSNVYGLKYVMPLSRFKSQVDFFYAGRVPHVHICGTGEPFLHPDIMAMIDYVIERYGKASFQSTFNRVVMERGDYLTKILERRAHISYIVTDIHAGNAEEHDAIKRGSSFADLLTTLKTLSDVGVRIIGNFILTRENHASLPGLIKTLHEHGIRLRLNVENIFPHMFNEFTAMKNVYRVGDQDIAVSLQKVRELAEATGGGIELELPRPFGDPTACCSVFWDKIQIWPVKGVDPARYDENLVPHACNAVVRGDLNSLGYVSDYPDVMALWNNPTLVALRTKILAGEAPDRFCWSCPCGVALKG